MSVGVGVAACTRPPARRHETPRSDALRGYKGIAFLREHSGWLPRLLGHVEAPAVDGGAGDRARHEQASGFHKTKRIKTAAPFTVAELVR